MPKAGTSIQEINTDSLNNKETLKEKLLNQVYWESTFDKLINKKNLSDSDKYELSRCYAIEMESLMERVASGEYEWSIPRKVKIKKTGTKKFRVVYIYSITDRLILGVLYNVLSDYYKDKVSDLCYSYKKGTNTLRAINHIKNYKQESLHEMQYGVKVDIQSYFNNISEERLHQMIEELFIREDEQGVKRSIENLMYDNRCLEHGNIINEYKGVIPGTPIASFFANYCLCECDRYFEEKGSIYARYSDDIIVIEESQHEVDKDLETIKVYLARYGLELNPKKYQYFKPGDDITFLGLKLEADGTIDMAEHSKQKVKKQIHRWCKKGRKEIELGNVKFPVIAKRINRRLNQKNFKCYIEHENTFGWCHYMFRYINTDKSLKEIDEYTKNTIRAMKTGKHNKANYRAVTEEEFAEMGWVSLVQLYHLYKKDFDYYCEVIDLF